MSKLGCACPLRSGSSVWTVPYNFCFVFYSDTRSYARCVLSWYLVISLACSLPIALARSGSSTLTRSSLRSSSLTRCILADPCVVRSSNYSRALKILNSFRSPTFFLSGQRLKIAPIISMNDGKRCVSC